MDSSTPSSTTSARLRTESGAESTIPMAPPPMTVPSVIGRYEVRECIGQGGMGVVLRAEDPKLGRQIAIKLLNARPKPDPTQGMTRLLREAQALARLSHPNVIDVFDVGTVEDQVFIAMEYVEGVDLQLWLGERPELDEIIDAFVQAGQGLLAAHRAGLVHRDFKPANVLMGEDGRVRVVDFGLAAPPREAEEVTVESGEGHVLDLRMTATGFAVGTPAYMSPEAHQGGLIDERSDQWSFCVSLYEALYGKRPFFGVDAQELADTLRQGLRPPPEVDVPPRLRELVMRGLSFDPDDRWPSMEEVLKRLAPPRRRSWLWVGAIGLVAATGGLAWAMLSSSPEADACEQAARAVDEAWSESPKHAVQEAFLASGATYAETAWQGVSQSLDAHALALAEARRSACLATPPSTEADAERADRQQACLGRRLSDLRGLVAVLSEADAATVRNAVQAVADLRPIEECESEARLGTMAPPPTAIESQVEQAYDELARVRALSRAGHYDRARALVAQTIKHANDLDYAPLLAEARHLNASVLEEDGEYEDAQAEFEEARLIAQAAGDDERVALASADLAFLVGSMLRRPEEAERWVRHARASIERLPDPSRAQSALQGTLGNLRQAGGDYEQARDHFEQALEAVEQRHGPRHPSALHLRNNIALSYFHQGDNQEAQRLLLEVLEDRITVYGSGHPEVAATYGNLGTVEQTQGQLQAAAEHIQLALDGLEASVGVEHPHYPRLLTNLANTKFLMGEYDEALQMHERSKTLLSESLGPRDFLVGRSLVNMGTIYLRQRRLDDARKVYIQARGILEEHLRPDHPEMASLIENLAHVDRESGRVPESIAGFDRALELMVAAFGKDNPQLAFTLGGRSQSHLAAEDYARAIADLRRALELLDGADFDPEHVVRTRYFLADALWKSGEQSRGTEMMRAVHKDALALGEGEHSLVGEVDSWLAEHDDAD